MYTIGQVSEMFGLPVSTIRYYDKEGLFSEIQRSSGIRKFSEKELETLRLIECLKGSGLEIRDIRKFIQWCQEGSSTYGQRRELFKKRKEIVEQEILAMKKTLAMIEFKCWYYEQAMKEGSEDGINKMIPDKLPEKIQELYDFAHDRNTEQGKV